MQQAPIRKNNFLAVSIAAVIGLGASGSAFAVNGYQMIGFGEDQVALGGAVTANPTSAMTALTNPAGLSYVGNRADFSLEAFMPDVKAKVPANPNQIPGGEYSASSIKKMYGIPSIGWVANTGLPNLSFGGGMYATAGLGADYPGIGYSSVTMFKVAPAISYKVTPNLSLGAALNINMLQLSFGPYANPNPTFNPNQPQSPTNLPTPFTPGTNYYGTGSSGQSFGLGGSVGMMFDVVPDLVRLGASYTTKANFQKTKFNGDMTSFAGPGTYYANFDFPQQAAAGIALMPNGPFSLSADFKWINYKDTLQHFYIDAPNGAQPKDLNPNWRDVYVYALGASYKSGPMKLMAGYNYSTSPVKSDSITQNVLFPAIIKHHITAGFKYELGSHWDVGGAIMYSPRETVSGRYMAPQPNGTVVDAGPMSVSNQITSIGMNLGYRF